MKHIAASAQTLNAINCINLSQKLSVYVPIKKYFLFLYVSDLLAVAADKTSERHNHGVIESD